MTEYENQCHEEYIKVSSQSVVSEITELRRQLRTLQRAAYEVHCAPGTWQHDARTDPIVRMRNVLAEQGFKP